MADRQTRRIVISSALAALAILAVWLWSRAFAVTASDLQALVENLDWRWVPVLVVLVSAHVALAAWRWSIIETGLGGRRPLFRHAFASGAFAMGLGTFLPAPLMNVASRSLTNKYNGDSGVRGAVSGTIDQMADFAFTAWLAIPAALALVYGDARIYFAGAPVMVAVGGVLVLGLPLAEPLLRRICPARMEAALGLCANRRVLARIYGISALRLANLTLITLAVHFASGAATVPALAVSVPLVTVAIAVAMLPGSIGSAEWSFSASLARQSIAQGEIVSFVLANRLLLTAIPVLLALAVLALIAVRSMRRARGAASPDR